jgi:hypothetical protein
MAALKASVVKKTFLTAAQFNVLELKAKGLTQAEIARRLKTSRANISILERRARENIARAEQTIKLAARLRAPVVLEVKAGTDIFNVPNSLYKAADAAKIRVKLTAPDIVAKIRDEARDNISGRSVVKPFWLAVARDGNVLIT